MEFFRRFVAIELYSSICEAGRLNLARKSVSCFNIGFLRAITFWVLVGLDWTWVGISRKPGACCMSRCISTKRAEFTMTTLQTKSATHSFTPVSALTGKWSIITQVARSEWGLRLVFPLLGPVVPAHLSFLIPRQTEQQRIL
jgi:hypothetical protein